MSPKPYESLDVTAKASTNGNCIILNIREGHSTGPYAYQLTSYRLTPDKAERLADMLDTALDEAENKRERNHDTPPPRRNLNPTPHTRRHTARPARQTYAGSRQGMG